MRDPELRRLAASRGLVAYDNVGEGECGPAATARGLNFDGRCEMHHSEVRAMVAALSADETLRRTSVTLSDRAGEDPTIADLMVTSLTDHQQSREARNRLTGSPFEGLDPSPDMYSYLIGLERVFFDDVALLLAAIALNVNLVVHCTSSGGVPNAPVVFTPLSGQASTTVALACKLDEHFVTLARPAGDLPPPPSYSPHTVAVATPPAGAADLAAAVSASLARPRRPRDPSVPLPPLPCTAADTIFEIVQGLSRPISPSPRLSAPVDAPGAAAAGSDAAATATAVAASLASEAARSVAAERRRHRAVSAVAASWATADAEEDARARDAQALSDALAASASDAAARDARIALEASMTSSDAATLRAEAREAYEAAAARTDFWKHAVTGARARLTAAETSSDGSPSDEFICELGRRALAVALRHDGSSIAEAADALLAFDAAGASSPPDAVMQEADTAPAAVDAARRVAFSDPLVSDVREFLAGPEGRRPFDSDQSLVGRETLLFEKSAEPVSRPAFDLAIAQRVAGVPPDDTEVTLSHAYSRGVEGLERAQIEAHLEAIDAADLERASFDWPLRTLEDVERLLRCSFIAPTDLVGFEFSGAVRRALRARGRVALSVDLRDSEDGGMHAVLDVRLVAPLRSWERAFFFPPCHQQLRADADCLQSKIADGRAFWGCLLVIFCLCVAADVLVVEQPDTILADHYAYESVELRSSAFGDSISKFIRLGLRNATLSVPAHSRARDPASAPLPVAAFANADERDRIKSSWAPFPRLCAALAAMPPAGPPRSPPLFAHEAESFALAWHAAGHPVPRGYLDPHARPPPASRAYQLVRGPGDGRAVDAVEPASLAAELSTADAWMDEALQPLPDSPASRPHSPMPRIRAGGLPTPTEPTIELPVERQPPTIDLRTATEASVVLVLISVLAQPLIYAHVNGFTVLGVTLPERLARSACLDLAQAWTDSATDTTHHALMVGEYLGGARLIAAPLDFAPAVAAACRTSRQRRGLLAAGAAFMWCTLAALASTQAGDAAARAVLAVDAFVKPIAQLADFTAGGSSDAVSFRFGAAPATSVLRRPILDGARSPPAWKVLSASLESERLLAAALAALDGDPLLAGWREVIRPINTGELPPELLASPPDFSDARLDEVAFSPVYEPLTTPWLPRSPPQPDPPLGAPACIAGATAMLNDEGRRVLDEWLQATLADLLHIRDSLASGADPASLDRLRPRPVAIGQGALQAWARGIVWDCRSACCVPLDYAAPLDTHLDLAYLRRRLAGYPDQYLLANLLEGVRLDADVELQTVLVPHLSSLPMGFASVVKELHRLHEKGWYAFFEAFPFWPMYLNGQGATSRKLEPDRWRRTTEGDGPRRDTFDELRLLAISINRASHLPHMPRHFAADERPEFRAWLAQRGLPRDLEAEPLGTRPNEQPTSKWPKEVKPLLQQVMRDMAVLKRAADLLGEPVYIFGDDVKDFFNQLAIAEADLPKLGIVFLRGDELLFVSERRLGFGTHGASNIAQRFSEALLSLFRRDMDRADAPHLPAAWRQRRTAVQAGAPQPCFDLPAEPTEGAPVDGGEASLRVCPQERLYAVYMYTDDPVFITVGISRTIRALRAWRRLTDGVGLIMAIPEKRSLGTWCTWLGVLLVASLGIVAVPKDKLLRAARAIELTLRDGVEFSVYRALCGLLEHLRAVNLQGRNVMHGLYRPHGPEGASSLGPAGMVHCDLLMTKQLQRWRTLLASSAGVNVILALDRFELEERPSLRVAICGDACFGDDDPSGLGGYCEGHYWYLRVPPADLPVLSIPILEFLAAAFNVLVFTGLCDGLLESTSFGVLLRTDALTTALTLPRETERSDPLVEAFQWLRERPEWTRMAPRLEVAHLFGDCNGFSDRVSRGRWREFRRLCAQVGVVPTEVPLVPAALELYEHVLAPMRLRPRITGGGVGIQQSLGGPLRFIADGPCDDDDDNRQLLLTAAAVEVRWRARSVNLGHAAAARRPRPSLSPSDPFAWWRRRRLRRQLDECEAQCARAQHVARRMMAYATEAHDEFEAASREDGFPIATLRLLRSERWCAYDDHFASSREWRKHLDRGERLARLLREAGETSDEPESEPDESDRPGPLRLVRPRRPPAEKPTPPRPAVGAWFTTVSPASSDGEEEACAKRPRLFGGADAGLTRRDRLGHGRHLTEFAGERGNTDRAGGNSDSGSPRNEDTSRLAADESSPPPPVLVASQLTWRVAGRLVDVNSAPPWTPGEYAEQLRCSPGGPAPPCAESDQGHSLHDPSIRRVAFREPPAPETVTVTELRSDDRLTHELAPRPSWPARGPWRVAVPGRLVPRPRQLPLSLARQLRARELLGHVKPLPPSHWYAAMGDLRTYLEAMRLWRLKEERARVHIRRSRRRRLDEEVATHARALAARARRSPCDGCHPNTRLAMCRFHPPRCPAWECALECGGGELCPCPDPPPPPASKRPRLWGGAHLSGFLARTSSAAAVGPPATPTAPSPLTGFLSRRGEGPPPSLPAARPPPHAPPAPQRHPPSPAAAPSGPRLRAAGASLAPTLPPRTRDSALADASRRYLQLRAESLAVGGEPSMQLDVRQLAPSLDAIEDLTDFGVNANTAKIDDRAWTMWEHVCSTHGASPLRTPSDVREFPQRQSFLLACLLLYAFVTCVPKDATRQFVKPRSALAYPLAIIRIFGRWGVALPGYKSLVAELNGMMRLYIRYHGPHSLAPRRAEPMQWGLIQRMNGLPRDGRRVGAYVWSESNHVVYVFLRLSLFLIRTGFRLAEIVAHTSCEIMYLTFACLTWRINGVWFAAPSAAQLAALVPGRDGCSVTPPRSKPDQWGEIHCPFTIFLVFTGTPECACKALREMEARHPSVDRRTAAVFGDAQGRPFSHGVLDPLLRAVLTHLYSAAVASLYSWHSYRSGLASMLHAAGVPDAVIMLMCRWMCEASLNVYRRIGSTEHESNFQRATRATVLAIQGPNVPDVVGDQQYAHLMNDLNRTRDRSASIDAFAAAQRGAAAAAIQPAAPPVAAPAARHPPAAPPPPPPVPPRPADLRPLDRHNAPGRRVLVLASLWPAYTCREHGGHGWEADIVSATGSTAVVRFLFARTRDGRPYSDERLPLTDLHPL